MEGPTTWANSFFAWIQDRRTLHDRWRWKESSPMKILGVRRSAAERKCWPIDVLYERTLMRWPILAFYPFSSVEKRATKSWALFFGKGLCVKKKGSYWGKMEGLTSRIVKSLCGSDFTSIWALFCETWALRFYLDIMKK